MRAAIDGDPVTLQFIFTIQKFMFPKGHAYVSFHRLRRDFVAWRGRHGLWQPVDVAALLMWPMSPLRQLHEQGSHSGVDLATAN
jgi:hypothetical protein